MQKEYLSVKAVEAISDVLGWTFVPETKINLQQLFDLLPEIGEKVGWMLCKHNGTYLDKYPARMHEWERYTHQLTDTYLQDGMSGVSEKVIELLSNL